MSEERFEREEIKSYLKPFKGLSKEYILDCVFDNETQKSWTPKEGDIIVGATGNVFVISVVNRLGDSLGGDIFFFGGGSCNRNGGIIANSNYQFAMNKNGFSHPDYKFDYQIGKFSDFRFVPYPHENTRTPNPNAKVLEMVEELELIKKLRSIVFKKMVMKGYVEIGQDSIDDHMCGTMREHKYARETNHTYKKLELTQIKNELKGGEL